MFNFNKKKIVITAIIVAILFIGIAAQKPVDADQHKNLKVLPQNISDDSLDMIMDGFKASLGVKCSFCHARQKQDSTKLDFPSDDKEEKQIARRMMIMTNEINQKYFNFSDSANSANIINGNITVTCTTCHRGEPHPEVK